MDTRIHTRDIALGFADREFIREQVDLALTAGRSQVDAARVWLNQVPGFEVECMLRCLVEIKLDNGRSVIGDSCEPDLYPAIERAAGRAGWNLAGIAGQHSRVPRRHAAREVGAVSASRGRSAA